MVYGIQDSQSNPPPVVLFGYDASPFANKIRLALRIKQIPFYYVKVPSMMPRPLLLSTLGVTYRKIPVLAIGREIYCDTALITEALEHYFPAPAWGTIYPHVAAAPSWDYRPLARGFASFWTDKPLFRTTTGLVPVAVWESRFGVDRAQLIGHAIDPSKLRAKIPRNLAALDLHLSLLEPQFAAPGAQWVFPAQTPSLADVSLYYQIRWGVDIAAGKGVKDLSGGEKPDADDEGAKSVWNAQRYPGLWRWFHAFEAYIAGLPDLQTVVAVGDDEKWKEALKAAPYWSDERLLVPTPARPHASLDLQTGLRPGVRVSVVPDDMGKDDPTIGRLVQIGVEEVVVDAETKGEFPVRMHFPRLGFVVNVLEGARAKM